MLLAFLIMACASVSFAQSSDYNKGEFYGGFSHNRVDTGISDNDPDFSDIVNEREGFNGVNVSITGNVTRYFGLKGDYAFHRKNFDTGVANIDVDAKLHTFVGGIQIKDNSKETKIKPFAHLMAGVANARFDVNNVPAALGDLNQSDTGFAGVLGGGLDIRAGNRVDVRVIQFDYNPTHLGDATQHNFRVGFGVAIH
jgi:hypothetical protein